MIETVWGISFIWTITVDAAAEMMRLWPDWSYVIGGVLFANALFLSWAWPKAVRKAIEDGEYDY